MRSFLPQERRHRSSEPDQSETERLSRAPGRRASAGRKGSGRGGPASLVRDDPSQSDNRELQLVPLGDVSAGGARRLKLLGSTN